VAGLMPMLRKPLFKNPSIEGARLLSHDRIGDHKLSFIPLKLEENLDEVLRFEKRKRFILHLYSNLS
jgi:hypothetical protein